MLPDNAPEWLENNIILLAETGSHAYGTATPDSDHDYKGICVPPISYYLGLDSFNEYNNTGGKNFKNTKDDVDYSVLHINKFVEDAMSGVPNNLELLFVRPEDYLVLTELGDVLVRNRHLFLSKEIKKKFGGYARSQTIKMQNSRKEGSNLTGLSLEAGYNLKQFAHGIRLITGAIEILDTGGYSTYRPNAELLRQCRNGAFTFEEAVEMIREYDEKLDIAAKFSKLPEKPDYGEINNLLIEINAAALHL